MTEYYIPTGHSETELVEKRSRFIGQVWRVSSEEEAGIPTTASPREPPDSPCSTCSSGRALQMWSVW